MLTTIYGVCILPTIDSFALMEYYVSNGWNRIVGYKFLDIQRAADDITDSFILKTVMSAIQSNNGDRVSLTTDKSLAMECYKKYDDVPEHSYDLLTVNGDTYLVPIRITSSMTVEIDPTPFEGIPGLHEDLMNAFGKKYDGKVFKKNHKDFVMLYHVIRHDKQIYLQGEIKETNTGYNNIYASDPAEAGRMIARVIVNRIMNPNYQPPTMFEII